MKQTYNGWTNYETWLVNLWFGDFFDGYKEEYPDAKAEDVAEYLEDVVREGLPIEGSGFVTDLLNAALGEVNWYELAENALAD